MMDRRGGLEHMSEAQTRKYRFPRLGLALNYLKSIDYFCSCEI